MLYVRTKTKSVQSRDYRWSRDELYLNRTIQNPEVGVQRRERVAPRFGAWFQRLGLTVLLGDGERHGRVLEAGPGGRRGSDGSEPGGLQLLQHEEGFSRQGDFTHVKLFVLVVKSFYSLFFVEAEPFKPELLDLFMDKSDLTASWSLQVSGFSWKNCGQPDDPAVMKSLSVAPDPISIPGTITASATGSTSVPLESKLSVSVSVFRIKEGLLQRSVVPGVSPGLDQMRDSGHDL